MPTGYRSSPSSLDSLGYRVDQRGLIYVLTVSDLVSLAVNIVQNGWTLSECLSRPRSEVIREPSLTEAAVDRALIRWRRCVPRSSRPMRLSFALTVGGPQRPRLEAAVVRSRPMRTIRAFSQRALSPEPARRLLGRRTSFVVDYRPEPAAPTRGTGYDVSLRGKAIYGNI